MIKNKKRTTRREEGTLNGIIHVAVSKFDMNNVNTSAKYVAELVYLLYQVLTQTRIRQTAPQ